MKKKVKIQKKYLDIVRDPDFKSIKNDVRYYYKEYVDDGVEEIEIYHNYQLENGVWCYVEEDAEDDLSFFTLREAYLGENLVKYNSIGEPYQIYNTPFKAPEALPIIELIDKAIGDDLVTCDDYKKIILQYKLKTFIDE